MLRYGKLTRWRRCRNSRKLDGKRKRQRSSDGVYTCSSSRSRFDEYRDAVAWRRNEYLSAEYLAIVDERRNKASGGNLPFVRGFEHQLRL